ncbi:uncharacterized protein LOC126918551 isoform X1 [Bombus affinis]|uniref:Uncharacterized protein LOC100649203 isoform X1 n=1 Tax=Bombus terrestris TaxID=30195 RepID=A0A9B7CZY0_BOMTE|nr:uncharacterized protein LOC100649203 isoform X1 [Bombus terrestris]XP_048268041.1 uncharacterized protein LOC100649203 isoform X1 [Bombus terrestris]XP_048268049.1 uncharacterized protein LOC100649203 isoform X1 [Bombus terrestris]XP_050582540.1 uncharacterized protein LOC126918551 isoform X1 [Bombus affinis]XP_050582541.1 uncharacterized protein LOC126918551 isoform X1 [Bombus affinis]XP_050582542.1 uncharacterized protein LOC126918551 isoform X1 [Bombus affinis]XP_050582543.1 uncharacter
MKLIVILATALCVTLVGSSPLSDGNRFQSEALNRLVMAEADNEAALRNKRTIGILRELFPEASQNINPEAEYKVNEVAAESQNNEVKVQFADEQGSNNAAPPLTPLEEVETEDDENRNKRFLSGLGGSSSSSGNFVFDIIRQAADGAARAAGTVYRVVAGTQSLGLGLSASRDLGPIPQGAAPAAAPAGSSTTAGSSTSAPAASGAGNLPPLVTGSEGDGSAGKAVEEPQEAIPGPVTRFFVIVNRGISNIVQDLILRLAATSERIVNFKARLITSVI